MQEINNSKFKNLMCSGKLCFNENNLLESFLEKESPEAFFLVFLWNDRDASWVFVIFYYSLPQNKLLRQKSAILSRKALSLF